MNNENNENKRIDLTQFAGHKRMFAMRDPESEDNMLLFVEDHFEIWPKEYPNSINEWYPELAEKYGEEHAFPQPKVSFYAPDPRKCCEHEWEGTNEINVRTMAAGPDLIAELKRCYERLDETEYRLEMAEDVLGRSDWNSIYRELIAPPE